MAVSPFSDWLKDELRRREWNMSDLARRLDISPSVVGRWIRDGRIPTPESCDRIADVLGLDVDRVLVLAGHRPDIERLPISEDQAAVIALVRRVNLDRDGRARHLRMMQAYWRKTVSPP